MRIYSNSDDLTVNPELNAHKAQLMANLVGSTFTAQPKGHSRRIYVNGSCSFLSLV